MTRLLWVLPLMWCLGACSALTPPPLLAPSALGDSVQVNQWVQVQGPEGELSFNAVWSVQGNRFAMAGLTPSGQLLFRYQREQHGDGIDELCLRYLAQMPDEQMRELARLIQWAYWPEVTVRDALPEHWQLTLSNGQRLFSFKGQMRYRIRYETPRPFANLTLEPLGQAAIKVKTLSVDWLGEQTQEQH